MAVFLTEFSYLNVRSLLKINGALVYMANAWVNMQSVYFCCAWIVILQHVLFKKRKTFCFSL